MMIEIGPNLEHQRRDLGCLRAQIVTSFSAASSIVALPVRVPCNYQPGREPAAQRQSRHEECYWIVSCACTPRDWRAHETRLRRVPLPLGRARTPRPLGAIECPTCTFEYR